MLKLHELHPPLATQIPFANAKRLGLVALLLLLCVTPAAWAIDVSRAPASQRQSFDGWGTSLAWWANGVGGWNNQQAKAGLIGAMFDQTNGLGLTYARYNIGGGQNRLYAGNFRPGALVPGWVPTAPTNADDPATWTWDWNADPRQRDVLNAAIAHGVTDVDAITYSPPYWMTISQDTAGNVAGAPNLVTTRFDELAHYQAEVVEHFYNNLGVRFSAVSPMNEANQNFWVAGGQQEGNKVTAGAQQSQLIEALGQALQSRGLPMGISAPEEFNASGTTSDYNALTTAAKAYITAIHTHVYGTNSTSSLTTLKNLATTQGKKLVQSEYGNNSTTGLTGGIGLAQRITADVNSMGVNAWTFWQVVEPTTLSGSGWGLAWANYTQNDSEYTIRKQYQVLRQFTSFLRPGSRILATTDANTVAAYDAESETTVLVATNSGTTSAAKSFDYLEGAPLFTRVIRTSTTEDFASLGPASLSGANVSLNLPGETVTTIVAYHRPNLVSNATVTISGGPPGLVSSVGSWQSSGNAGYELAAGLGAATGGGTLKANASGVEGKLWQADIGSAATNITGKSYQLSLDVKLLQLDANVPLADASIGFEFYGADQATLAHSDPLAFSTLLAPAVEDTQWRTYRTPIVVAPAGTRYVRPVVRIAGQVANPGDSAVSIDNVYLQEIRYRPRGRSWQIDANSSVATEANWDFNSSQPENANWYFGPVITAARSLSVGVDTAVRSLTFESTPMYRLGGAGKLLLDGGGDHALLDARAGTHQITSQLDLQSNLTVQALASAALQINSTVTASGFTVKTQGAGSISFGGGLQLEGGELQVYASSAANTTIGGASVLDGALRVLLEPGQSASLGQTFELVKFSAGALQFASVAMPTLPVGLRWQLNSTPTSLMASVLSNASAGDFNSDGLVDATDYTIWRDQLGATVLPGTGADGDGNGMIGEPDYQIWVQNFGLMSPATATANAVPELPGSFMAGLAVTLLVIWYSKNGSPLGIFGTPQSSGALSSRLSGKN